jgi:RNA polymerase sigma-70 factor (ECF subfamily)
VTPSPYADRSDDELIALARGTGPAAQSAMSELLGRWRGRVYGWCRRFVRDHERALDLSQEVLLNVYRSFGTWEGRGPFGAWVFTIARHACIRAMRKPSLVRDDDADLESLADPAPPPETLREANEREARVLRALEQHLSEDERRALWLRCMERRSVDEITLALGLTSASGARGLLQTARRRLRAALEREGVRIEGDFE